MREVAVWLTTYTPRLFLFVLSRRVEQGEDTPKVYGCGKEVKEIYTRHAVNARGLATSRIYMYIHVYARRKGAYTHSPGRSANKYNTPAWAAIVRTRKVKTREKPTVNRRFRS